MTLTYKEAARLIGTARDIRAGKPLENNTRLYQRGSDFAVRLHATDVVTVHPDSSATLSTGGWYTVTTKDRMNSYGPARVYSSGGSPAVWCVWHASDPLTAPRVQKCRACKGTGRQTRPGWTDAYGYRTRPAYEVTTRTEFQLASDPAYPGQKDYSLPPVHVVGQVVRHDSGTWGPLEVPVVHPAETHKCYRCDGKGTRDYGSKANPVRFYDGITVDSSGKVTDPDAPRLYDVSPGDAETATVLAAIKAYVAGLTDGKIAELWEQATTRGTAGDCWFCSMFDPAGASSDDSHLRSHILLPEYPGADLEEDEAYYMPSLIMNALKAKGYRYPEVIFASAASTAGSDAHRGDMVRSSVSRYLRKRLIAGPVR